MKQLTDVDRALREAARLAKCRESSRWPRPVARSSIKARSASAISANRRR